jgi:hypothetical protein
MNLSQHFLASRLFAAHFGPGQPKRHCQRCIAVGIVLLAFVGILALKPDAARADAPPAFAGSRPPQLSADANPTAQGHLTAAQKALEQAQAALVKATTDNRGGYVEKARTDIKKALADVAEAAAFVKAHPENNLLPSGPAPAETSKVHSALIPTNYIKVPGLNMMAAIDALNVALNEFVNNHESNFHGPVFGDFGGYRLKIMNDIGQTSADVLAAIAYTDPDNKDKKVAPTADAPISAFPTAIAGLALSLAFSLGGLHFISKRRTAK